MADHVSHPIQIRCPGCQAQFRLTPKRTATPLTELPCPACHTTIHVPPYPQTTPQTAPPAPQKTPPPNEQHGWTRVSLGSLFNRPDTPKPEPPNTAPTAQATPLQNRFRPIATTENLTSHEAPLISNLGVFNQASQPQNPPPTRDSAPPPTPISPIELDEIFADIFPPTNTPIPTKTTRTHTEQTTQTTNARTVEPGETRAERASVLTPRETWGEITEHPPIPSPKHTEHPPTLPQFTTKTTNARTVEPGETRAERASVLAPRETWGEDIALPPIPTKTTKTTQPSIPSQKPSSTPTIPSQKPSSTPPIPSPKPPTQPPTPSKKISTRIALLAALLLATATTSALAVHFHHSTQNHTTQNTQNTQTTPDHTLPNTPETPTSQPITNADLSELRSLWSAIAVASETVTASTKHTPRQKILGLIEAEMPVHAQNLILQQFQTDGLTPENQALFDMNLRADPRLRYQTVTIQPIPPNTPTTVDPLDERHQNITSIDELRALGGGRSLSFRMMRGGENLYAFKPDQREWEGGWRTEIAAYNLCFIMVCHFNIPENRPARISRTDFEALYARTNTPKQRAYAERFDNLIWLKETDPETQTETEYLYGTLKEWIPNYALWPIEYEDIWQPWLDHTTDPALLEIPLEQAIDSLKTRTNQPFYTGILREKANATTLSIAQQISSLLIFDYLTNNHDRFSLVEDYYGVNNHFANGKFTSIDNGAAFQYQPMQRVQTRFEPITRFSRSTLDSLHLMRPEAVNEILFPNPTSAEILRLNTFWLQRKRLLERTQNLTQTHPSTQILIFD